MRSAGDLLGWCGWAVPLGDIACRGRTEIGGDMTYLLSLSSESKRIGKSAGESGTDGSSSSEKENERCSLEGEGDIGIGGLLNGFPVEGNLAFWPVEKRVMVHGHF